jgi:glutaminyl-peptide cyclotransferase
MEKKVPNGRMSLKYIFAAPLLALAFFSCQDPAGEPAEDQPEQVVQVPHFNSDSAYAFVKAQVDFGPRVPGTAAHQRCGDYLAQKLSSYRLSVTEQKAPATTYDGKKYTLRNIIGSYKPELGNRILLVAHWDTRPFADRDDVNNTKPADGANDGASGAGVLLEIARLLSVNQPEIGVDILLTDLEDYGQQEGSGFPDQEDTWCLGSQYWARNPHKPGYNASFGILLDMVGGKEPVFPREGNSMRFASHIVDKVWSTAAGLGYSRYFVQETSAGIVDDHYYINVLAKIPTIDIIPVDPLSGDFPSFHHRHSDNMSSVDPVTLGMVGKVVAAVLYRG